MAQHCPSPLSRRQALVGLATGAAGAWLGMTRLLAAQSDHRDGDGLTLAYWNTDLNRAGPGLLLRDATRAVSDDIRSALGVIDALGADVLVLSGFDYDAQSAALAAFNAHLSKPYPHLSALRPNSGVPTGLDLDGNGRMTDARDAQAFGRFPGEGGMAVLSRLPFLPEQGMDLTGRLWRDMPGATMPPLPEPQASIQRLSSNGHHVIALALPDGRALRLLTWHASPPAFDADLPVNLRRNHDETAVWLPLIDDLAQPLVVIGQANTDPVRGRGDKTALNALLNHPALQDSHSGDTVDYGADLGRMRVSYILPSRDLRIIGSGHGQQSAHARHWPIWMRLQIP